MELLMKNIFLLVFILLTHSFANAKVLVISDIDDTLKVTNLHSNLGAGSSLFDRYSHFAGMAELFKLIQLAQADVDFHYVSLAPQFLMEKAHHQFLKVNNFPITGLHTNPGIIQDPNLKQKAIRTLIKKVQPDLVIYFGDNGQYDTLVYRQMANEFKEIPSITYIREAYSKITSDIFPTLTGQVGFVTSLEVTMDLIQKGILPMNSYLPMEKHIYEAILADDGDEHFGKMVFPHWQDCGDLIWRWNPHTPSVRFQFIKQAIIDRCQL